MKSLVSAARVRNDRAAITAPNPASKDSTVGLRISWGLSSGPVSLDRPPNLLLSPEPYGKPGAIAKNSGTYFVSVTRVGMPSGTLRVRSMSKAAVAVR